MAPECSIVRSVAWNWVIEALACSETADLSILTSGLIQKAPAISGDTGRDIREIVSLKILESLFDSVSEAKGDDNISKISFDSSRRCEDVLKKIFHETPQMAKLEKENWDVGSFLNHKRSSLPNCSLKKLKEAILDDNNPLSAALREKSKLVVSSASKDTNSADDVNVPQGTNADEHMTGVSTENMDQSEFVKSKDSNNIVQPNNERVNDDNNPLSVALREKGKLVVLSASKDTNSATDVNVPQGTNAEEHIIGVSTENMDHSEVVVKSKDSNNIVQPNNERVDDDEILVIAAKKDAFLKSHINSLDLLPLDEFRSKMEPCMKCNGNGDLLVCSSDSCLLRFHENCLGSTATLDDDGKFLCPFCACTRAISKCQEAERNASQAKKNLQAFYSFTAQLSPNKSSKESEFEAIKDTQMGTNNVNHVFVEKDSDLPDPFIPAENEDIEMGTDNINCVPIENDSGLNDPSIPNVNDHGADDPSLEQTTELSLKRIPYSSTAKQKHKEKESQLSDEPSSAVSLRVRKAKRITPPVPLLGGRKRLRWTNIEEEKLMEGVKRYSTANNKKIPWTEILKFGHDVFHKGRTTIDLKDKWRNLCK